MSLSLSDYEELESRHSANVVGVPSPIVKLLRESTHKILPYITQEHECLTYFDHESPLSFERYFDYRLGKMTPNEFDLIQTFLGGVCRVSDTFSSKPHLPKYSLVDALYVLRVLSLLHNIDTQSRIIEFGSSAGVVGALCALRGYSTQSVEFSQARFLAQSRLSEVLPTSSSSPRYAVIPWWEWLSQRRNHLSSSDIIVCNESLRDFAPDLLEYLLVQMRESLECSHSSSIRAVICYLTREEGFLPWRSTWEKFYTAGFSLAYIGSYFAVCIPPLPEVDVRSVTLRLSQEETPDPLDKIIESSHLTTLLTALEEV